MILMIECKLIWPSYYRAQAKCGAAWEALQDDESPSSNQANEDVEVVGDADTEEEIKKSAVFIDISVTINESTDSEDDENLRGDGYQIKMKQIMDH